MKYTRICKFNRISDRSRFLIQLFLDVAKNPQMGWLLAFDGVVEAWKLKR
ncbi:MAG: hypothetical protein HXY43_04125 [Fischerella sp.]|jgi:hypothetical protein|nr:hypothetical protein [Fischerella sp.]NWF58503.1 hypothetical protein [Fischerella sp.]